MTTPRPFVACHGTANGLINCPCPVSGNKKTLAEALLYARRNGYTCVATVSAGKITRMDAVETEL